MPCLIGCLALSLPRFVLALTWLFSDYLGRAIHSNLMLLLGFVFLPTTTLAYAYARHTMLADGGLSATGWILVLFGFFLDVVVHGGGGWTARRRRRS